MELGPRDSLKLRIMADTSLQKCKEGMLNLTLLDWKLPSVSRGQLVMALGMRIDPAGGEQG